MKIIAAGFLLTIALAACGGGSSGTPPINPGGTPIPAATYSSKLVFTGPLAGAQASKQIQGALRRVYATSPGASPIPIMIVSAPDANANVAGYGGEVNAVVSPLPSTSPSVTFSQTNAVAVIVTPAPLPSGSTPQPLPTGVIAQTTILGTNAVQVQSAGTATAEIGSPVNASPTTPVYSYMSLALDCYNPGDIAGGTSAGYASHFGWKWTGSTWAPDDNVADADVYIDGPNCDAPNPSETTATVHVPGGDTRISTDTPFNLVTASQWADSETAFAISSLTGNADGSVTAIVVGKTRDGSATFKLFPNALGTNDGYFGAIEVSGDSIDGF